MASIAIANNIDLDDLDLAIDNLELNLAEKLNNIGLMSFE